MVAKKTTAASATTDAAETVETMVKAGQEAAQQSYEKAVSFTQENVDKAAKAFMGGYDEFATLGKGNYDAYVSSMNVLVKAFEEMGKEVFTFTQGSLENSVKVGNELMAAKTLNQVVDVQNTSRSPFSTLRWPRARSSPRCPSRPPTTPSPRSRARERHGREDVESPSPPDWLTLHKDQGRRVRTGRPKTRGHPLTRVPSSLWA